MALAKTSTSTKTPHRAATNEDNDAHSCALMPMKKATLNERRLSFLLATEKQEFVKDDEGQIDSTNQQNIRLALTRAGYEFGYDEFAGVIYYTGNWGQQSAPIDDAVLHRLWLDIDTQFGFRPSLELFTIVVMDFARQFAHHAVRDYLDELEWDECPRLNTWLTTFAGAEDTEFNRAVSALTLVAAVRRVRQPGCKFDELPVLQGDQGDGKSSLIKALVPIEAWFSDSLQLGDDPKLTIERSRGVWIAELGELVGSAREVERIKSFLSRHVDGPVRMAYARLPVRVERQFIAIGSTNEPEFLRDVTGNRRFWPVATSGRLDVDGLIRDRDQVWAEAAAREAAGESIRLPEHLWAEAAKVQEAFREKHPWEHDIEEKIDLRKEAVAVSSLWAAVGVRDTSKHDLRNKRIIDGVMRRHGFVVKKKIRVRGEESSQSTMCWLRDLNLTNLPEADVVVAVGKAETNTPFSDMLRGVT